MVIEETPWLDGNLTELWNVDLNLLGHPVGTQYFDIYLFIRMQSWSFLKPFLTYQAQIFTETIRMTWSVIDKDFYGLLSI